jgi:putative oxidoreductase
MADDNRSIVARWKGLAPYLLSLLRIVAAVTFMLAGTMKLFAFPMGMPPNGGTAPFPTQMWFGGVLEVFGGLFILIGLCTRPIAFVLSGMMAVAYFQFHAPEGFWPTMNGGVAALMYCFVWLYFSAAGPGPWSVDAMRASSASNG